MDSINNQNKKRGGNNAKYQVDFGRETKVIKQRIGDTYIRSGTPNRPSRSPGSGVQIFHLQLLIDTDAALDRTKYIKQRLENDRLKQDLQYVLKLELTQLKDKWTTRLAGFVTTEADLMLTLLEKCEKNCCSQSAEFGQDIDHMEKILTFMYNKTYTKLMGKRLR